MWKTTSLLKKISNKANDRSKENEKAKVVIKKDDGKHEFDVKQGGNGEIIDKDDENHKKKLMEFMNWRKKFKKLI